MSELDALPSDVSLLMLIQDEENRESVRSLLEKAQSPERPAHVHLLWNFIHNLVDVEKIVARYNAMLTRHRAAEGEEYRYVDLVAVDGQQRVLLSLWIGQFIKNERGLVQIVSEYGEGKTTFCQEQAFAWLKGWGEGKRDGSIPLFFPLNESRTDSLENFILNRLRQDYGLFLTIDAFRSLCRDGTFIPILDAFDQMGHGSTPYTVVEDYILLRSLAQEQGTVIVTCRLNYFEQHLKVLQQHGEYSTRLLRLNGLEELQIREMLQQNQELLEIVTDQENWPLLESVALKPLTLRVMLQHAQDFLPLWKKCKDKKRSVRAYDLFALLFDQWLQKTKDGFMGKSLAEAACRAITLQTSQEGMNIAFDFKPWAEHFVAIHFRGQEVDQANKLEAIRADLKSLPLLDFSALAGDQPRILFRFNAFLEFLIARFVLGELESESESRPFLQNNPLTQETRDLVVGQLDAKQHPPCFETLIEAGRYKTFRDTGFQGGNALTLLLDVLLMPDSDREARSAWRSLLKRVRLDQNVLRGIDARSADLSGINLSGSDLDGSDFSFSILQNVNLEKARLKDVVFNEVGMLLTAAFITWDQGVDADGWRLAGGTENGMLLLWDKYPQKPGRARHHREAITALDLAGDHIYSASLDGNVVETSVKDPNSGRRYPMGMGELRAMAISSNGQWQAVAGQRSYIVVRQIGVATTPGRRITLPNLTGSASGTPLITAMTVSPDMATLFAGDSQGTLWRVVNWTQTEVVNRLGNALSGSVAQLIPLEQEKLLVIMDGGQTHVLDGAGEEFRNHPLHGLPMQTACFAPQAQRIYWRDGASVKELDIGNDRPIQCLNLSQGQGNVVLSCSADGRFLAVGGETLDVWERGRAGFALTWSEPMRMNCRGLILRRCVDLVDAKRRFLVERGAVE